MSTTEGLDARAASARTAGGVVAETELRAVLGTMVGSGGPLVPEPAMLALGAGALVGGAVGAGAAAAARALLGQAAWSRPTLWALLAAAVVAVLCAAAAMRRWRGVPLYRLEKPLEAAQLAPGVWVAIAGERRPWQRLAEVEALEDVGGPYGLIRVGLGNGTDGTVARNCRVPVASLVPPSSLLSWPGRGAGGPGR